MRPTKTPTPHRAWLGRAVGLGLTGLLGTLALLSGPTLADRPGGVDTGPSTTGVAVAATAEASAPVLGANQVLTQATQTAPDLATATEIASSEPVAPASPSQPAGAEAVPTAPQQPAAEQAPASTPAGATTAPGTTIPPATTSPGGSGVQPVAATSGATAPGFVSRNGDRLVLDGAPYTFVGMNIYNANSRNNCWYPMQDAELGAAIDATGADVIRSWFFAALARTPDNSAFDFTAFDETIASARARGVRVVVTLADHWGACETTGVKTTDWYRDGYRTDRSGLPTTYRDYVAAVVSRYANDPTVLSWQLVNEPESKDSSGSCAADGTDVLRAFAADMSAMIRAIDPNHLISLGTIGSGQCGAQGDEYQRLHSDGSLDWCELHDYNGATAFGGDAWNGMDVRVRQCAELGLPVVIGESGVTVAAAGSSESRASLYAAKVAAGAQRGVDGFLAWGWAAPPAAYGGFDDFAIVLGDPVAAVLAAVALS
jgi:mannan endo-1,4-beta-mannosidase